MQQDAVLTNAIFVLVAISMYLLWPALSDEIWQDEAYTLIRFASKGPLYPFSVYPIPNNHPLFSSILSLWWERGDSILHIRLLPYIIFFFSLIGLAWASINTGGEIAVGLVCIFLLVANDVTRNFVLQIRGYSISWLPVSLMLLSLPKYISTGKLSWGIFYCISSAILIALIPSNLVFASLFLVWGLLILYGIDKPVKIKLVRVSIICLPLVSAILIYFAIWDKIFLASKVDWSSWNDFELLYHFFWSITLDFWYIIPLLLIGLYLEVTEYIKGNKEAAEAGLNLFLISCIGVLIPLWIVITPKNPYPRSLVPLIPVIYYIYSYLFVKSWNKLFPQHRKISNFLLVLFLTFSFFYSYTHKVYAQKNIEEKHPQNLCNQPYRQNFYPSKAVSLLEKMANGRRLPVLADFEGFYSLGFLRFNCPKSFLEFSYYKKWRSLQKNYNTPYPPVIVATDSSELLSILKDLKIRDVPYLEMHDTGYFKIYVLASAIKKDKDNASAKL